MGGGLTRALAPEVLRGIGSAELARFLAERRWFGAKGRTPASVRIADVVPLAWGDDVAALARVEVALSEAECARYQLPLVVREAEMSREGAPRAVLARVESGGARGLLFDAVEDAEFRARLGRALVRGATFEGELTRVVMEPVGAGAADAIGAGGSRVVGVEQSNTSVVYGDRAILKLFRRLEPGEHPDVEISHFLTTRTRFRHTPELLGVIRFWERDGTAGVAGMLSRYFPGATDGWSRALAALGAYLRASAKKEPPNPFVGDAEALGRVTRELHEALASDPTAPGFAPQEVTPADVEQWAEATRRSVERWLDLLQSRLPSLDAKTAPMARAIAGRRAAALDRLDEIVRALRGAAPADARKIRHHGDYHLGQVLHTREGEWMIIDFEGEPARPLAERRELHSPYRDVAGMLRSFAYAAATGAAEVGGLGVNPTVERRSARWERDARRAFLAGYGAAPDQPLIALFEMEKVFYELAYELNNRPGWVWIPLRGIAKAF